MSDKSSSAAELAQQQFPILRDLGIVYKSRPGAGAGNKLEFWPRGEGGGDTSPRPRDIPIDKPGVEIYDPSVGPLDVLGDIVSHHLIHSDPTVSRSYKNFEQSLTPDQKKRLSEQYEHAKKNAGETRDYKAWETSSGLPAYFRGYPFKQWPDEFNERAYTPDQRKSLDEMMNYLRGSPEGFADGGGISFDDIPSTQPAAPNDISFDDIGFDDLPNAQAQAPFGQGTLVDYPLELGKGAIEGAKNLPASALKGWGASATGFTRQQMAVMDRIDAGASVPDTEDPIGYQHMTPEQRAEVRGQVAPSAERKIQDNPLFQAGAATEQFGKEALAPRPGFEPGKSWTRDIGSGFGSMAGGIALSMIPFGGPAIAGSVFLGAGMGEAVDKAIENGATQEQAVQAARMGAVAGATDVVDALIPMLGGTGRALGLIKKIGMRTLYGALAEGGQEGLQQFIQNAIAKGIYKPDQDLLEDVPRSAAIGAIVGGATTGGHAALEGKDKRGKELSAEELQTRADAAGPDTKINVDGKTFTGRSAEDADQAMAELDALLAEEITPTPKEDKGLEPKLAPEEITPPAEPDLFAAPSNEAEKINTEAAAEIDLAAEQANPKPSEAQSSAGNYAKGHVKYRGLDITIETPRGAERTGVTKDGEPWSVEMPDHYGYIKRTEGADGDQVDVYVGPKPDSDRVFVVDQKDAETGDFDEHKVLLGYETPGAALDAYEKAFSDGRAPDRIADVAEMSVPEFKDWLKDGDTTKPAAAPQAQSISFIEPSALKTDAKRFQYKGGADESGVTGALKGVEKWDERLANPVLAWEAKDGTLYVANGHQRTDLAKRAEASGQEGVRIPTRVLREADGYSPEYMRALGAFQNIAEGTGTAVDAAKVLRANQAGLSDIMPPLPPRSQLVQDAKALSNLSDDAFGMVVNDIVPEAYAAQVGRLLKEPAEQLAAMDVLAKATPANVDQARIMVEDIRNAGFLKGEQTGLFGEEEFARSLVAERARILDRALKNLRKLGSTFKTAVEQEGALSEAGNKLERESNIKARTENERLAEILSKDGTRKGPISDELSDAARQLADGKQIGNVTSQYLSKVRSLARGNEKGVQSSAAADRNGHAREQEQQALYSVREGRRDKRPLTETVELAKGEKREQFFIPGAERASQGAQAQRASDAPLKPKKAQKPTDFGLFGDEKDQGSLFDISGARDTKTDAFKKWFGDSKVVGNDGRPMVVYHGTAKGGFDTFDTFGSNYGLMGQGSYFTDNPDVASKYTTKGLKRIERDGEEPSPSVYPVYLSIKNPLDMEATADVSAWKKAFPDQIDEERIPEGATNEKVLREIEEFLTGEQIPKYEGAEIVHDGFREMGFDGVTHIGGGRVDSEGVRHRVWIAFDPEQIKSATGNRGTFDPKSPNLLFDAQRDLTKRAKDKQPQIEKLLTNLIRRVAGEHVKIGFSDQVEFKSNGAWGSYGEGRQTAAGTYRPAERLIRIALADPLYNHQGQTALHESFHAVEHLLLNDREMRTLKKADPELRATAQKYADLTDKQAKELAGYEVRAIAFEAYSEARANKKSTTGIPAAARAIFARLRNFLDRVRNGLNGMGFKTASDVFSDVYEGKMAGREAKPRSFKDAFDVKGAALDPVKLARFLRGELSADDLAPGKANWGKIEEYLGRNFDETARARMGEAMEAALIGDPLLLEKLGTKERSVVEKMFEQAGGKPPAPPKPPSAAAPSGGGGGKKGAQQRILDRIVPSDKNHSRLPTLNDVYTLAKDDLNPLRVLRDELSDGKAVPIEQDPYRLARLARGAYGKAEQMIENGTFSFKSLADTGKGLTDILKPVKNDLDGFRAYMAGRRTLELASRDIKTGISVKDAQEVVRDGAKTYAKPFEELVAYQRRVLDYLRDSGIVGPEAYAAMVEANKDYVPFFRMMEDGSGGKGSNSRALRVKDPIKGIKGSNREIIDPIESIIKNTYLYVGLAEKNRALTALDDLAAQSPKGEDFVAKPKDKPPSKESIPLLDFLKENGIDTDQEAFAAFKPEGFRPSKDNIAFYRNGRREVRQVAPDVAEAVNAMDRESFGLLMRILAAPARLLRLGATQAPEFIVRNPIRDQFSATILSEHGYIPVYDFVRGLGSVLKNDKSYQDWLKSGGSNATLVSMDRKYIENEVMKLSNPTVMGKLKNVVKSPVDFLRMLSELAENATRVGEFKRAVGKGKTPMEAAFSSREVTLDFARIGAQMRGVNALIPFFNASLEGTDREIRAFKKRPLATSFKVAAAITLPSVLLWFANHDDERYEEIPQWQKDLFWLVFTKDNVWRIPKPFALGVLFGSVPERALEAFFGKNPNAFKHVGKSIKDAFLPNMIPAFMAPTIEQFANRSTFTERPIIPKYLENVLPEYQYAPYTSETAKLLGKTLARIPGMDKSSFASPMVIDNYVRAWTGGLGQYAVSAADKALRATGVAPTKVDPTLTPSDMPVIKAFAVRHPSASAQSIQDFYETYEERKKALGTVKYLMKLGDKESAQSTSEGRNLETAERVHKALGQQMKFARDVWLNKDITPEEKRTLIDRTYMRAIEVAKLGNKIFRQTAEAKQRTRQDAQRLEASQ